MTREEAIKVLSSYDVNGVWADVDGKLYSAEEQAEAFDMAIEALQKPPISQRSMYQAGYRQGREETLKQVTGKLNNSDDSLFTADPEACKEQKSKLDLISRQAAIDALGEEPPVWCDEDYEIAERNQWREDVEAIKSVPSADRPKPIDPTIRVDLESGAIPRSACEPKGPKTIIYADKPRGEWIDENNSNYANCSKCGYQIDTHEERGYHNFCPNCGADMRGKNK